MRQSFNLRNSVQFAFYTTVLSTSKYVILLTSGEQITGHLNVFDTHMFCLLVILLGGMITQSKDRDLLNQTQRRCFSLEICIDLQKSFQIYNTLSSLHTKKHIIMNYITDINSGFIIYEVGILIDEDISHRYFSA